MNARRKMFSGIVFAAAALLALSGCKKDEGEKVVLSAEFEQPAGGQKTYINDHSVCWTSGDAVRINGTEGVAVSDGSVEAEASETGYAAVYPSENSTLDGSGRTCTGGTVVIPADQAYATTEGGQQIMRSPMAARLDAASGRLYFKNLHSLIRVDVTTVGEAFALESITITSTEANLAGTLGFTFQEGGTTADAGSAPTLDNSTLDKKSVTLNFSEPITLAAHTIERAFYLCVAPFTSTDLEIKVTGTPQGGTYAGKKGSYVFSRENKQLNRSIMAEVKANFGEVAFKPEPEPEPFKFSVSSTLQVEFSPGNLQYNLNSDKWRFAPNQWDRLETNEMSIGDNYAAYKTNNTNDGWMGLFCWGTSGWSESGAKQYKPFATSKTNSDYYPGGSYTNNLTGNYAKADWGVYNAIYNPKTKSTDADGTWRTLTKDEWTYLLGTSGSTRGGVHKDDWWIYNMVKITDVGSAGVTGLIIYPDGVTEDITGKLSSKAGTSAVSITKADFEKLEAIGCVFLPAAGYRKPFPSPSVDGVGSYGYYWSSTSGDANHAYMLSCSSSNVELSESQRIYGRSVRLVKNVKE